MNVSELTGAMLDYWVAKAECLETPEIIENLCQYVRHDTPGDDGWWTAYEASTEWSIAGPIIERERIDIHSECRQDWIVTWVARTQLKQVTNVVKCPCYRIEGHAPLVAAMRAYVATKFGDTVPDEEQCTGCQYEIEHNGKKVCRTMTRTHGQQCDAFRERKE